MNLEPEREATSPRGLRDVQRLGLRQNDRVAARQGPDDHACVGWDWEFGHHAAVQAPLRPLESTMLVHRARAPHPGTAPRARPIP